MWFVVRTVHKFGVIKHFSNLRTSFFRGLNNGGNVIVNIAECIRSHIVTLGRNVARKYDGSHVRTAPYFTYVQ
jgi:hypothetical protein